MKNVSENVDEKYKRPEKVVELLRLEGVKEVLFESIVYTVLDSACNPALHGPTATRSRFCESINFFISEPKKMNKKMYLYK